MIDLRNLFKNYFDTAKISDDTVRKGAKDHLARLNANNQNGNLRAILNDTQAAYREFCAAIDTEDQNFATQQASTLEVDAILDEFKKNVSRYEGAVRSEFGIGSKEYQEFFPQGQSEYALLSKSNAEMLMERMDVLCRKYSGTLSNTMVTLFANYNVNYETLRTQQLQYMANNTVLKSNTAKARTKLELQMCKNLLLIAAENVGNPNILNTYFDQSIFRPNKAKDDGSIEEEISPSGVVVLENKGLREDTEITIKNKSAAIIYVGIYASAGVVDTATAAKIEPNDKRKFIASELGDVAGGFLNARNVSLSETARLEYLVL
jgi:hypothetical protein